MDKEIVILDKLTDLSFVIDINELAGIDWYKLLLYSLKSKTICIIYNSLKFNECLQYIPAKIYKIMSALYIGNFKQNQIIKSETEKIIDLLNRNEIKIYQHKHINIIQEYETLLMPNDIDFIAFNSSKYDIHKYLTKLDYKIKYLNNYKPDTQDFSMSSSVFYEKNTDTINEYPLKIDITYSFKNYKFLDRLLKEYEKQNNKEIENIILFIINIIDFFDHINGKKENISIDDFFKIKRLQILYFSMDTNLINSFVKKYNLESIYGLVKEIFLNYLSIF